MPSIGALDNAHGGTQAASAATTPSPLSARAARPPFCHRHRESPLRHAFITAALEAGVPVRDVQEAASHADRRTMMRYDRGRQSSTGAPAVVAPIERAWRAVDPPD